jgi:hypothetical protein
LTTGDGGHPVVAIGVDGGDGSPTVPTPELWQAHSAKSKAPAASIAKGCRNFLQWIILDPFKKWMRRTCFGQGWSF